MALTSRYDLFLNNARPPGSPALLTSLSNPATPGNPVWVEADKFLVRLRFAEPATNVGAAATPVELPIDNVIVLAGKKTRGTGNILFSATNFTKVVVPAGETTPFDCYYQAILNLNTESFASAFTGGAQTTEAWVDVEISAPDAGGGDDPDRITYQFQVNLARQAYAGEGDPVAGPPVYPAPELITLRVPANGAYRFVGDGGAGMVLQIKNGTTGKFHTLFCVGAEGAETLTIGPGEV